MASHLRRHRNKRQATGEHPEGEAACYAELRKRAISGSTTERREAASCLFWPPPDAISLRRNITGFGAWVADVPGSRNLMGVLALVRRDDRFQVIRRPLDVLAHRAARVRAFVVAPAHIWSKKGGCFFFFIAQVFLKLKGTRKFAMALQVTLDLDCL